MTITVVFALAAAFANAVNIMTQHSTSLAATARQGGWRLALYLLRNPLWLFGTAAALGGFVFCAIAPHDRQLAVVQPLLTSELVVTLVLRRMFICHHVVGIAWASAAAIGVALAVFLVAADPHGGISSPTRRRGCRRWWSPERSSPLRSRQPGAGRPCERPPSTARWRR